MKVRYVVAPVAALAALVVIACGGGGGAPAAVKEIQTQRTKEVALSLLSEKGELAQGQNQFVIAFRSAANDQPVDAGTVTVSSSMAMPGMAPMTAPIEVERTGETGRYAVKGEFAMSGAWRFEVRWDGPAGQGSTVFSSNVR
jgi:hypothetical protein